MADAKPEFLAYTITSSLSKENTSYYVPCVRIGSGPIEKYLRPANPQPDSYWIVIISAKNPTEKVKEWIVPGYNNAVPPGIEAELDKEGYIFAVATHYLATQNVPQDAFYNFLAKYGASRELQRLEQLNATLSYGTYGRVSYVLTGPTGGRGPPRPATYEIGAYANTNDLNYPAILMMSLQLFGDSYGLSDTYTFNPHYGPRG